MMTGLFVVGGGIFSTGLAKRMGTGILGLAGTSETKLFVLLMLTTSVVGAFVSNTGTVALMLPIVVSMARGAGVSPARMLMPLAFAGSMGGMLTLIGTPPNLIVRDALVAAGYAPLTFFSFTPIGILCIVVGTLALIPLSRKFLKERTGKNTSRSGKTLSQLAEEYKVGQGLMAAQITLGSPMMGKTLKQLNVYNAYGVNVIEIRRIAKQGAALRKVEQFALADVELQTDDVLYLSGSPERINLLIAENALLPQKQDEAAAGLNFYDVGMAEILILPTSALVGRTVAQAEALEEMGVGIDKVVDIEVSDERIIQRLSGRRVCSACGASYHTTAKPSVKPDVCDRCGGALIVRKDDEPATILERLKIYHELTEPLVDFYRERGKLVVVEGQEEVADTTRLLLEKLGVSL